MSLFVSVEQLSALVLKSSGLNCLTCKLTFPSSSRLNILTSYGFSLND